MLLKLQHIHIYCSDMQRSLSFYRDKLGFPVKLQTPERTELHSGMTSLVLLKARSAPSAGPNKNGSIAGSSIPSIAVLDFDKFFEEMKTKGVDISLLPAPQMPSAKHACIVDPDGLVISVSEEKL